MKTLIPPPRIPIIDDRTGLMAREWYVFFNLLFARLGGGNYDTDLPDLEAMSVLAAASPAIGPGGGTYTLDPPHIDEIQRNLELRCELGEIKKAIASLSLSPSSPSFGDIAAIQSVLSQIVGISYYSASMAVNAGTLDTGSVGDLSGVGGTDVGISEVTGADPLRVTFAFSGVARMSAFVFYGYYSGSTSHQLAVEIYNVNTTNWDSIGTVGSETAKKWYSFPIFNQATYISSGAVSIRFRHLQSGTVTHDLYLDYVELNFGSVAGASNISASAVTLIPSGNISSTSVGAAIVELDSEKQATLVSGTTIKTINGASVLGSGDLTVTGTGEMNVQADWNQTDNAQDDYIKNKPALGTAAAKNIPAAGNASSTEVVYGSDTRLSDSRTASDVYTWAKAATKPSYTAAEVGATTYSQVFSIISLRV